MQKQKLVIVVGPTASGKTNLGITIAKQFSGEIISADSRQVYRGLDIGTAKVTLAEMKDIPHHLIDIVDVGTTYTANQFKHDADLAIQKIAERGNLPIVAGGTFFYVDTLLGKITSPKVSPNPELRAKLETRSLEELFAELQEKDPRRADNIDRQNKRRLIRALEIIEQLGEVPQTELTELPYDTLTLGIQTDPVDLRERLEKRAKTWLIDGFLQEMKTLAKAGVSRENLQEIGFEYLIGLDLLEGRLTEEKFLEVFVQKNWQYAKRQLTWLKRDPSINWVSPADQQEVELLVKQFLLHH